MSILNAYRLAKSFGVEQIFSGITLQIQSGEKVALVGPNGAGKSTLLNLLAGVDQADSGEIVFSRGLRVGYLSQQTTFSPGDSLRQAMLAAFEELRAREAALKRLEERMSSGGDDLPAVMAEYSEAVHSFERDGGYTYEHQINRVLVGLGFPRSQHDHPVDTLSGGQRTRAALARLLLSSPDLLLLDEPTNHLDLDALEWLEDYLLQWPGSALVVAHDRRFLDKVVTRVLELSFGYLEDFPGNYTRYTELRADRLERRRAEYEAQAAYIARTEDFIRRYGAGQRAREAKGREKRLARLERLQRPADWQSPRVQLTTQRRSGDNVLTTRGLGVGYPNRMLFACPDLTIHRSDRVALIGPNGCGKTTFLRTILGQLPPLAGHARLGANVRPGYYAQAHDSLHGDASILNTILPLLPHVERARSFLARYLFTGDEVYKSVGNLSGGERSRVALALLSLQGANLLIMDEPTNHLDLLSQEVLEDVLTEFPGTLLFVSHDRYFIDALATHVWCVSGDSLRVYEGDYEDYLELRQRAPEPPARKPARPEPPTRPKRPARIARTAAVAEETIAALETRLRELEYELTTASQRSDVARVRQLGLEYQQTQQQLDAAYVAWEAISEI